MPSLPPTLSHQDQLIINQFSSFAASSPAISQLILFGSKATGQDNPESDIDLLAIVDQPQVEASIYAKVAQLLSQHNTYISIKVLPFSEFNRLQQLNTPFIQNLSRQGIILWQKPSSPS